MDLKDRKLLYLLDINSRTTDTELAKELKTSKQVVGYRLKQLENKGIIKEFQTVLNMTALGNKIWAHTYFKLSCNETKEKEIIQYLQEHRNVAYIAQLGGRFDLSVVLITKDLQELEDKISGIITQYPEELDEYNISLRTYGWKFAKKYLWPEKQKTVQKAMMPKQTTQKIDETDKKILKEIAKNSRIQILHLSNKLNIPFSTVRHRIKQLEKNKIITGYSVLTDMKKISYENYKALIRGKKTTKKETTLLRHYAEQHPNITYFMKTLGEHQYEMRIETESQENYQKIIKEIRTEFNNIIENIETIIVFKEIKEDFSAIV